MCKVSIILPSYNVVKYIEQCLESAVEQTLSDIEILCIDAGSYDGTCEIIEKYEKKDHRIRLFRSNQKSYGYQVNIGIKEARGEYVGILETDDLVLKNMYEELYNIAKSNNLDFVKADFYRFTGEGQYQKKVLYKLDESNKNYNHVIDISKKQDCFRLVMNTWSGIYNTSFLKKNNIYHNETPGASFQDNGFWFQTFMYAKRAYFVDKPYYMNRRDNENSSVFSEKKTYCICDEYSFIYDCLKRDISLKKCFANTFGYYCYCAYKNNLKRIAEKDKYKFIQRYASDFRTYMKEGIVSKEFFACDEWDDLMSVIYYPQEYYELIKKEDEIIKQIKLSDNIVIYGAGGVGRYLYTRLAYCKSPANVVCFAVTSPDPEKKELYGKPILDIKSLVSYKDEALIVIATSDKYTEEIKATLDLIGFSKVIIFSLNRKLL